MEIVRCINEKSQKSRSIRYSLLILTLLVVTCYLFFGFASCIPLEGDVASVWKKSKYPIGNNEATVTGISITTLPLKTSYTIGESLNLAGLVVTAYYSDGSSKTITDYTNSGFSSTTAGSKTVTITYKGCTDIFTVMVNVPGKTLSSITVANDPSKKTYNIGESLNTSGLVVRAWYSDDSTTIITDYVIGTFNSNTGGEKEISISWGGKSASFFVTVNAKTWTVTFNSDGANTEANPASINVAEAIPPPTVNLPTAPTKTGFNFGGWFTEKNGAGTEFTAATGVTASVTVYAKWNSYSYTITFDGDGATTQANPTSKTVATPAITIDSLPIPPAKTGWLFGGWFTGKNGVGIEFNGSTTVTSTITVFAKWNPYSYTITFDGDGATTQANPTTKTVASPATTIDSLPTPPVKTDYQFCGWFTEKNGAGTEFIASTVVTGNITVWAQWKQTEITGTSAAAVVVRYVVGGSFERGKDLGGGTNTAPVFPITMSGFYMGKYQVTQKQWQAVMGNDDRIAAVNSGQDLGRGNNYPMYYVNWYDAIVFCNMLSKQEGLSPAYRIPGKSNSTDPADWGTVPTSSDATWNAAEIIPGSMGYRLPTEAQWEYAAKGGTVQEAYTFAGSNNVADVAWYSGNSGYKSHEVGTKKQNSLGLYDMSGNVFEWCWDWNGTYHETPTTDPVGASSGANRVIRGGSWSCNAGNTRCAYRLNNYPNGRDNNVGFRLARPSF